MTDLEMLLMEQARQLLRAHGYVLDPERPGSPDQPGSEGWIKKEKLEERQRNAQR